MALDPQLQALLGAAGQVTPSPAAAPATAQATPPNPASGLDPQLAALLTSASQVSAPTKAAPRSGPQLALASLSSLANHPFTTGLGLLENGLSGVSGGLGSLADAVTGSDPGTHDWAYQPRSAAGQDQAGMTGEAATQIGRGYDAALGTGPLAQTLKERLPEAASAAGTVAMLPEIPKAVAGISKLPIVPFRGAPSPQMSARTAILQAGQDQGYVVPPSTGNPTFTNKLLGGIAGKTKVQQLAQATNRDVTARGAVTTLGKNPDEFVPTPENLSQVSRDAFQSGYVPVKGAGEMTGDDTLNSAVDAITQRAQGANRSFPGAFQPDAQLNATLQALKQPKFDAGDAIDAISELRSRADDAYGSGQGSIGKAYKDASKALEDAVERNLIARGVDGSQMLQDYRNARTTIAKANSIKDSLTGDEVDATKLATQLQSGRPLTGPLSTAAKMASVRAFKPSMALPSGAAEGISPLDVYGAVGGSIATGNPAPLLIPFTREGLARYLLSPAGQARAIPKAFRPPPITMPPGLLSQIGQLSPAGQSLLNTPSNP